MANSFVENINNLANAAALAGGDVVEDTTAARDLAVSAKNEAVASAANAKTSELLAQDWSNKGHNNPVTGTAGIDAEYSAYHWKTEAEVIVGDPVVNDLVVSGTKAFSSQKTTDLLATKASSTHNHDNVYEPKFLKGTAFNKNFGHTATDVATGYHVHDGTNGSVSYEPAIGAKGTSFNKNFGTTLGTVAEGNHNHDTVYEPKRTTSGSAYNKNFVVDSNNPLADEIPRGNHIHKATGVSFDNTSANVITSTTVQGAISQLDSGLSIIKITEKCKLTAGMTDPTYLVDVISAGTPVQITAGMTVVESKNAIYSNGIQVNYSVDPTQFVEGFFSATVSINAAASKSYALQPTINGVAVDAKLKAEVGDATIATNSIVPISISGWLSGLSNGDVIGLAITNVTDATDITIVHATMSFAGQPEGALISNSITVTHSDALGRDAVDSHPISAITNLQASLDNKSDITHTHLVADITDFDPTLKADKAIPAISGSIALLDAAGNLSDSGVLPSSKANINGDNTQIFKALAGVANDDVVNKGQVDTLVGNYTLSSTFNTHEATANPHGTTYTDVGAAPTVHTHAISDVTNLQTTLDGKYNKVAIPVTGNLPRFAAGDVLEDSGFSIGTTVPAGAVFTDTTDHTALSNIGTKTHAEIDTHINAYERIDKAILMQDVVSMTYTGGTTADKLSNVTYTNLYSEDLVYNVDNKLEFVDHKYNGIVEGYTTLAYTAGKLTSSTFTLGAR